MSLTIEQTDAAILKTFYDMEEGAEYILNDFCFDEVNRLRRGYNCPAITNRKNFKHKYKFARKGHQLYVNNKFVFDFLYAKRNFAFTLLFAFTFALVVIESGVAFAVPFAFQHNELEKLSKNICDGKVVEIDGKKYKLTAV